MKIFVAIVAVLSVLFVINLYIQGQKSLQGKTPGLSEGKLQACPNKPNCVCSENPEDKSHYFAPLALQDSASALDKAATIIQQMGGMVLEQNDHYLAATFTSDLFKFVDDFELRLDSDKEVMHIRSASRVGYGDMNVNKNRAAEFKTLFEAK